MKTKQLISDKIDEIHPSYSQQANNQTKLGMYISFDGKLLTTIS